MTTRATPTFKRTDKKPFTDPPRMRVTPAPGDRKVLGAKADLLTVDPNTNVIRPPFNERDRIWQLYGRGRNNNANNQ